MQHVKEVPRGVNSAEHLYASSMRDTNLEFVTAVLLACKYTLDGFVCLRKSSMASLDYVNESLEDYMIAVA